MPGDTTKTRVLSAEAALDRYFLETRCKLIEIAANLDRILEGAGAVGIQNDKRLRRINEALDVLRSDRPEKAKACQMLFSLPYETGWRSPGR